MAFNLYVESSKAITSEGVGAALEDDCCWYEMIDAHLYDSFEHVEVALIIDPVIQRNIDCVVSSTIVLVVRSSSVEVPCSGEKVERIVFVYRKG